jgi:hypothetical protein
MANNRKPRKAYRPKRKNNAAHIVAMTGAAWLTEDSIEPRCRKLEDAVSHCSQARGSIAHWRILFDAVNLLQALIELKVCTGDVAPIQELIETVLDRTAETGSSALHHHERQQLAELVDVHREVISQVTFAQLFRAQERVAETTRRALASGGREQGVRVIDPKKLAQHINSGVSAPGRTT